MKRKKAESFKIRPMKITDYEQVYKLWKSSPGVNLGLSDTKPYIKQYLKKNKGLSYVALDSKEKVIGTVLAGLDRRRAYIYHVTVAKKYRSKGIGHVLMQQCEASLKKLGLERCTIFVDVKNSEAKKFWLKEGWYFRRDLIMMQKNL